MDYLFSILSCLFLFVVDLYEMVGKTTAILNTVAWGESQAAYCRGTYLLVMGVDDTFVGKKEVHRCGAGITWR